MPGFLMNKHFLVQPHHFHVGEFFKIIGNQVLKISSSSFLSSPRPTRTDTHKFPITVALLCYAVGGWSGLFGLSWISPSTLAAAQSASTPGTGCLLARRPASLNPCQAADATLGGPASCSFGRVLLKLPPPPPLLSAPLPAQTAFLCC